MGDIDQLRHVFGEAWDWSTAGEEWSKSWGGTPSLWYGALLPRLQSFVPTGTILEIAPGFGRWTQYLVDLCERLVLVDLAPVCIDHCRTRFADRDHVEFHVNDGRSLDMVADESVDLMFSWDSLVHADIDIIRDYVSQIARKLTRDGVAFIHHSNARKHARAHRLAARMPERVRRRLVGGGVLLDVYAWRSPTVSAVDVARMCESAGLSCVSQELFPWEHGRYLTEAITVMTRPGSAYARPTRRVVNRHFRRQLQQLASTYAASGFPGPAARLTP